MCEPRSASRDASANSGAAPWSHAEQQARGRVARHGERAAERPHHVEDVTRAAVRQPLGAGLARQEHELDRAAVVRPHVVDGERAPPDHARLRAADGDRDELAGPEPGGDGRGDHGHGDVRVDAPHREHRTAHLNRRHAAVPIVACHPGRRQSPLSVVPLTLSPLDPLRAQRLQPRLRLTAQAAACSCRERTPMSPRMVASMPCTAAASPATVVTQGTPLRTAAVRIS